MDEHYIKSEPEDGYIRTYTFQYCSENSNMWIYSSLNWTTPKALLDYLSTPRYNTSLKIEHKDILIEDLKRNPHMPFVSAYVYEELGLPWEKRRDI